jgi:hypothetical protein
MFDMAQEEMQAEIDRGGAEVGDADEDSGVPLAACVAIVLKVARDNADSAASVQDVAWEQVTNPRETQGLHPCADSGFMLVYACFTSRNSIVHLDREILIFIPVSRRRKIAWSWYLRGKTLKT